MGQPVLNFWIDSGSKNKMAIFINKRKSKVVVQFRESEQKYFNTVMSLTFRSHE